MKEGREGGRKRREEGRDGGGGWKGRKERGGRHKPNRIYFKCFQSKLI